MSIVIPAWTQFVLNGTRLRLLLINICNEEPQTICQQILKQILEKRLGNNLENDIVFYVRTYRVYARFDREDWTQLAGFTRWLVHFGA